MTKSTRKMNRLFKLTFVLRNYPINKALKEYHSIIQTKDIDQLNIQQQKAWNIFEHHLKNNSLYRNYIGENSYKDWNKIPILTKTDIQAPLDQRLTRPYTKKNVFVNNNMNDKSN